MTSTDRGVTPQSRRLLLRLSGAVGPNRRSGRRLQYARLTRSPPALHFQAAPTARHKYLLYLPLSNPYAVMQTYLFVGHFSRWGWGSGSWFLVEKVIDLVHLHAITIRGLWSRLLIAAWVRERFVRHHGEVRLRGNRRGNFSIA
ncbi:hypothetical protein BDW22DRAFT_1348421 [Trametopsis cervina]|nr:hypothetical protein BDW22DRAFT_1348421 [Trametopsis cervina]